MSPELVSPSNGYVQEVSKTPPPVTSHDVTKQLQDFLGRPDYLITFSITWSGALSFGPAFGPNPRYRDSR